MHRLVIHKLGPIERCSLELKPFLAFTGFQASGKSTAAKAIYYFRTIKDDIVEIVMRQAFGAGAVSGLEDKYETGFENGLKRGLEDYLKQKFTSTFGSVRDMSDEMYMEYYFTESCFVKVSFRENRRVLASDFIQIAFSDKLGEFLHRQDKRFSITPFGIPAGELEVLKMELCRMFDDSCTAVYIPAGRSMITLLSQQLSYVYATMTDVQKRALDSCTRDYLEHILRIRAEFSEGLLGLAANSSHAVSQEVLHQAFRLIKAVLRGTYQYQDGEEQIVLDNGKHVKVSFSSSGQQECVWILNLLFYYLVQKKQILFIIEEPEAHLFPASQKYMTEFIALVNHCGHSVVLTTHSPYVLGTLNNLLYAHTLRPQLADYASKVIPDVFWIDSQRFDSWFVKDGTMENCMDSEICMIQNERIDEISKVINEDFDRLVDLQEPEGEGGKEECR